MAEQEGPFCPTHDDDWLAKAVRGNRVLMGLPPQPCLCAPEPTRHDPADAADGGAAL